MKGLYIAHPDKFKIVYGDKEKKEIGGMVDMQGFFTGEQLVAAGYKPLNDIDVIFSTWGMAKMDPQFLAAAPRLKAVFHAAGTIKSFVTREAWERDISISSAYVANGVAVAEFTLAQILFSLKLGWHYMQAYKSQRAYMDKELIKGAYASVVGIISLGAVGRKVCELLKSFAVEVIAYDPFASPEAAAKLGVRLCSLEEVFAVSDVVSLHTPLLPETRNMIGKSHFARMKANSAFINTARGAVVNEADMLEVLRERPDIYAVLDVTVKEPPEPDSLLYSLPNVVLTPHIAGAVGLEGRRMACYMAEECERFIKGEPLRWRITKDMADRMA